MMGKKYLLHLFSKSGNGTFKKCSAFDAHGNAANHEQHDSKNSKARTLAIIACNESELHEKLNTVNKALEANQDLEDKARDIYFQSAPWGPHSLAFLFPGQGSQRLNMLDSLKPVLPGFSDELERLDSLYQRLGKGSMRRIIEQPFSIEAASELTDTRNAQPALGIVEAALVSGLADLQLKPQFFAGHSFGELTALCFGEAFDEETLLYLSHHRGRLMAEAGEVRPGAMIAVMAPQNVVEKLCDGVEGEVSIANHNAPSQFVLSGDSGAIAHIEAKTQKAGVYAKRLKTSCAFHSPLMAPLSDKWREVLARANVSAPLPQRVLSNAAARLYDGEKQEVVDLLTRQLSQTVRFCEGIEALYAAGARIFVEVGPGRVLSGLVDQTLDHRPHVTLTMDPGRADARLHLLRLLAILASHGVPMHLPPTLGASFKPATNVCQMEMESAGRSSCTEEKTHVLSTFFQCNQRVVESFFSQQNELIELIAGKNPEAKEKIFSNLIETNKEIIADFLRTQKSGIKHLLLGNQPDKDDLHSSLVETVTTQQTASPAFSAQIQNPIPAKEDACEGFVKAALGDPQPALCRGKDPAELKSWLLKNLADLTGYPQEMVHAESDFENDLGLDSLTMMEFFVNFSEAFPRYNLEGLSIELRRCRTIDDVVSVLNERDSQGAAAPRVPPETAHQNEKSAPRPPNDGPQVEKACNALETLEDYLRFFVATALGVEETAVDFTADWSKELHLDAFTMRDIVHELTLRFPHLRLGGRQLLHQHTLQDLVDFCENFTRNIDDQPSDEASLSPNDEPIVRYVKAWEPLPEKMEFSFPQAMLLVGPAGPHLLNLSGALKAQGTEVATIGIKNEHWIIDGKKSIPLTDYRQLARCLSPYRQNGRWPGALFLAVDSQNALSQGDFELWTQQIDCFGTGPFIFAKALIGENAAPPDLPFYCVIGCENDQGVAARGVLRALHHEWPNTMMRAVWLEQEGDLNQPLEIVKAAVQGPTDLNVSYCGGRLQTVKLVQQPLYLRCVNQIGLTEESKVLLIGGADGITAEIACMLAEKCRCKIVAVGRTPYGVVDPFPEIRDSSELKRQIASELKASGEISQRLVIERLKCIERQRAILRTEKRIEKSGGSFVYKQADARDFEQMRSTILSFRRELGAVDGVILGAGIIDDGEVSKKSIASFQNVLHTKARAAFLAYYFLRGEPLKFAFLFSSLTAYTGNKGQSDYVAANEIIDAIAKKWNSEASYPVRSLLWSVWKETGLVPSWLREHIERQGLPGISNAQGTELFWKEMRLGRKDEDWVVLTPPSIFDLFETADGEKKMKDGADQSRLAAHPLLG